MHALPWGGLLVGIVLASAGHLAAPEGTISARDHGVKGDGSSDEAAALSKSIAAAIASRASLTLPPGTLNVGSTITIRNGDDFRVVGAGSRKTYIRWIGPPGLPVVRMLNCYRTVLEGMSIDGTKPGASELVLVQNDDTVSDYALPSSLNVFRDMRMVGGAYAVRFAVPRGARDIMNDQSRFERIVAARQTVASVSINGQNSRLHAFHECSFTESPRAVIVEDAARGGGAGGSFHWFGGYVVNSIVNFEINGVSIDGVSLYSVNSESSPRFLTVRKTLQDFPVNIIGCRYSAARLHADGYAMILGALGPYHIVGSHWGEQLQREPPKFLLLGVGPTAATIESNVFGSLGSVSVEVVQRQGPGPYDIVERGNLYRSADGSRVLKRNSP